MASTVSIVAAFAGGFLAASLLLSRNHMTARETSIDKPSVVPKYIDDLVQYYRDDTARHRKRADELQRQLEAVKPK